MASSESEGSHCFPRDGQNLVCPTETEQGQYPQGHLMCIFTLPLRSYSGAKRKAGAILTLGLSTWENESEEPQCNSPCAFPWLGLSQSGSRVTPEYKPHLTFKRCFTRARFSRADWPLHTALHSPWRALGARGSWRQCLSPLLPPCPCDSLQARAGGSWGVPAESSELGRERRDGCRGTTMCSANFLDHTAGAALIYSQGKGAC